MGHKQICHKQKMACECDNLMGDINLNKGDYDVSMFLYTILSLHIHTQRHTYYLNLYGIF